MPIINPEEAIKDGFKNLKRKGALKVGTCVTKDAAPKQLLAKVENTQDIPACGFQPRRIETELRQSEQFEEILVRKVDASIRSGISTSIINSESTAVSRGGDSVISSDGASAYVLEEIPDTSVEIDQFPAEVNDDIPQKEEEEYDDEDEFNDELDLEDDLASAGSELVSLGDGESGTVEIVIDSKGKKKKRRKRKVKTHKKKKGRKLEDRRRTTWLPCTCPQYKVSKQLATRKEVQGIFFCKVMSVKVIQLLIINIVIFSTGLSRDKTLPFFKASHDWAYLAYGIFITLLVCLRVAISYRARWPMAATFLVMIPLTLIIAFTSACITVVYNSVLIPLVTCSIFLTFLVLSFTPYLLQKHVMNRSTNCAAASICLLASIFLIFLKEMESTPISYWDFISHVWLPSLLLAQFVVQVTVLEIQRMLFGLCFNVSSIRWPVAALYL